METIKLGDSEFQIKPETSITEDFKIRFELCQQICDLLSDLVNNFDWDISEKNQLVYTWTQVIKVYWDLCEKASIVPLPKL